MKNHLFPWKLCDEKRYEFWANFTDIAPRRSTVCSRKLTKYFWVNSIILLSIHILIMWHILHFQLIKRYTLWPKKKQVTQLCKIQTYFLCILVIRYFIIKIMTTFYKMPLLLQFHTIKYTVYKKRQIYILFKTSSEAQERVLETLIM